jgi:DNA polymerase III delta prime subunit
LSELLRPQQLGDLTLADPTIQRLKGMVDSGQIMNMLFYGESGTGKTSAARILIKAVGGEGNLYEVNGSSANGIGFVRDTIEKWAARTGLYSGPKICFVDEADWLTPAAQAALRYVIEKKLFFCRFLFTANDLKKLKPAIQSRMMPLCFDIEPARREGVLKKMAARYESRLSELGISYDPTRLREIVHVYYPDFRAIANNLQFEFGAGGGQ